MKDCPDVRENGSALSEFYILQMISWDKVFFLN